MESRRISKEYFYIPKRPDFLAKSFELQLTAQSQELFDLGKPGQGYIGLVDLETGSVHLYPSYNKNDGLLREDKNGGQFPSESGGNRFVTSKDSLGSLTGDLHINATSELDLVGKSGRRQLLMGFGLWKAGCAIKLLTVLPIGAGLVPNEYLLVKERDGWKLFYVDFNRQVTQLSVNDFPQLQDIQSVLNNRLPNEIDKIEREEIEKIIREYHRNTFPDDKEDGIKYAKNRSTSQNSYSCLYVNETYKRWFQAMNLGHTSHTRDLERELPFPVFDKIMTAVCLGLDLPPIKDLANSRMIPGGIDGIKDHFGLEATWSQNVLPEMNNALANLEEADLLTPETFELITKLTNRHTLASDAIILLKKNELASPDNIDFLSQMAGMNTQHLYEMADFLVYLKQMGLSVNVKEHDIFEKLARGENMKMLTNVFVEFNAANIEMTESLFEKILQKAEVNNNFLGLYKMQMAVADLKRIPFNQLSKEALVSIASRLMEVDSQEDELIDYFNKKMSDNNSLLELFNNKVTGARNMVGKAQDWLVSHEKQHVCEHFKNYFAANKHEDVETIIKNWAEEYAQEFGSNPFVILNAKPNAYLSLFAGNNHFIEAFNALLGESTSESLKEIMSGIDLNVPEKKDTRFMNSAD